MVRSLIRYAHKLTGRFKILRFVISGGLATVAHIGTFFVLTHVFDMWYMYATTIGFVFGFSISFTLQKYWTFAERTHGNIPKQGARYFALAIFNLLLNDLLILLMVEHYDILPLVAQIVASACIACETFFASSIIFKSTPPSPETARQTPPADERDAVRETTGENGR